MKIPYLSHVKSCLISCGVLFSMLLGPFESWAATNLNVLPSRYQVCFTPGSDCTQLIVDNLNQAKESIFIQAYSFTSVPIAKAVVAAKRRYVPVYVILDKSQSPKNNYSSAKYLLDNAIETYIDYKPAIAHNKVIIIDGAIVITGSFNFTKAAQFHNAENLLIIHDANLAKLYLANWYDRRQQSMSAINYQAYRYGPR